jgi:hypothetical protein
MSGRGRGRIDCRRDGWSDVVEGGWNIGGLRTLAWILAGCSTTVVT